MVDEPDCYWGLGADDPAATLGREGPPPPGAGRVVDSEPPTTELAVAADERQAEARRIAMQPGKMRRWRVEWVPIEWTIPADYNPRVMPPEEMAALGRSLEHFGQVENLVVNTFPGREGIIVGGHQRRDWCYQHEWPQVEVKWVHIDPAGERLLNLALNRIRGDWDPERLQSTVAELEALDADLELTGFTAAELTDLAGLDDLDDDDDDRPGRGLKPPKGGQTEHLLGVMVECQDEREQRAAFDLLTKAGYTCKVITV